MKPSEIAQKYLDDINYRAIGVFILVLCLLSIPFYAIHSCTKKHRERLEAALHDPRMIEWVETREKKDLWWRMLAEQNRDYIQVFLNEYKAVQLKKELGVK